MTPNHLLRKFFERLGHELLCIDWRRLGQWQVEPLLTAIGWLPPTARDQIESTLAAVYELGCASGVQAILEVARRRNRPKLATEFPDDLGPHGKAMWVWLDDPELFSQAATIHQVDQLTHWRKRKNLPRVEPRTEPQALGALAEAISQLLRHEEGRGHQCTVEHHARADGTDYFLAFPDDFVETVVVHDKQGNLTPLAVRQTFEIVFAYHRERGTLELVAKVPPQLKPRLEGIFGQIILNQDIGPWCSSRPYDLNRLKDRYFCLDTDPLDGVLASICRMRIDVPQCGRLTVEPTLNGHVRNIYQVIDECLDPGAVAWETIDISMATFRFHFAPIGGRIAGSLTFDVTYPDHCTIRSRRPERIELTRKYLRRWRIADV